ncbi:hypothetical protein [Weissella cibaria]|uniref:hypothetical protein n=1 Tax=Weissella cibaria TaxID=137591 RepID=UPI003CC8A804
MNNFINEKLLPPVMKFVNTKAVAAIKNGMLYPIPFIVIGAVFLILGQFPIQDVQDYLNQIGLGPIFMQANNPSFRIMTPLLLASNADNLALYKAGKLTLDNVAHIVTESVSGFATYAVIAMVIIPPFNGMYVLWTTPAIVSGLIVGGW